MEIKLAVYLSPEVWEKLVLRCVTVALWTCKRWVLLLFLPLTSFAIVDMLSMPQFLHLEIENHGKYTVFCRTCGKTLKTPSSASQGSTEGREITATLHWELCTCLILMGSWCFTTTCVEFAHTSPNLHSLPDLNSPSHWHCVLGQVVYSNEAYLWVLDICAIHLSSLSRLIVNVHPQINRRQGSCCACRVLLSLSGRKHWLALPPAPSRPAAGVTPAPRAVLHTSHFHQTLMWLWQRQGPASANTKASLFISPLQTVWGFPA